MTIKDFFWFKKEEYEERIKDCIKYSNERIHKKRAQRSRQQYDAYWSIGTGLVCCVSTGGLSLGISAYDYRQRSVSKRKLALLEKEAERRGMKKYEGGKRDFWISCISNSAQYCVGCGVNSCIPVSNYTEEPAPSEQDVAQITDEKSEAGEQSKMSDTVLMIENRSEAGEHGKEQNPRMHVPLLDGTEEGETRRAVESAQETETKEADLASNQVASSALGNVGKKSSTKLADKKKHRGWKREFCISCISNSVGYFVGCGVDSCVTDMLTQSPVQSVQNVVQTTVRKSNGAPSRKAREGPEYRIAVESAEGPEAHGAEIASNQVASSALGKMGKKSSTKWADRKKYRGRKRRFWISCISNSLGLCIGSGVDSCLPDMLTEALAVPSVEDVVPETSNKLSETGDKAKKSNTVQMTNNPMEAGEHGKRQNRAGTTSSNKLADRRKPEGQNRKFWISYMSNSVAYFGACGVDSCLADRLIQAPDTSVQDVSQMTEAQLSEAGEQAKKLNTVQMTDSPSEVEEHVGKQNARVQGRDRISDIVKDHVSEPQATVHPKSDVQKALPQFHSIDGPKAGKDGVVAECAQDAETNGAELLANQITSSALDGVGMSTEAPVPSVQDVVQMTDEPLETEEQAKTLNTVQMTDHLSEAGAGSTARSRTDTRVQSLDGAEVGEERVAMQLYAQVEETSDVELASDSKLSIG